MAEHQVDYSIDEELQPTYNREEVLTAVTAFYQLLQRMYLPNGSIKYPPASGWLWPVSTTFSPPKTDNVVDIMKHLPYLRRNYGQEALHIYEKTEAVDYSSLEGFEKDGDAYKLDPEPRVTTLPAHVLMMGFAKGRDGHYVYLDTERGTWTLCDFQIGPKDQTDLSEVSSIESEIEQEVNKPQDLEDLENVVTTTDEFGHECTEKWREYPTYTTAEFFEKLTREFTELYVVRYFHSSHNYHASLIGGLDTSTERRSAFCERLG